MYRKKVALERPTFCDAPNTSILTSHEYPSLQNKRVETDLAWVAIIDLCGVWRALNSSLRLQRGTKGPLLPQGTASFKLTCP